MSPINDSIHLRHCFEKGVDELFLFWEKKEKIQSVAVQARRRGFFWWTGFVTDDI